MRALSVCLFLLPLVTAACNRQSVESPPAAPQGNSSRSLLCYSGPSMRQSMEELARVYEERTGVQVVVETNDPRSLIDKIVLSPKADLFISHDPFLPMLVRQGVAVREAWCVGSLVPTLAVKKGNPKQIRGLEDLARPGVRVGLTETEATISAHIVDVMLKKAGITAAVEANVVMRAPAGRYLVTALNDDQVDAGIIWNAVVFANRGKIEPVEIRAEWRPERNVDAEVDSPSLGRLELDYVRVTLAELASSQSPAAAHAFAEFIASPEGIAVFTKNGFSPADPDRPVMPQSEVAGATGKSEPD